MIKAKPVRLVYGKGYEECEVGEATHVTLNIPGPTGVLTLPIILSGSRKDTGSWSWNGSTEAPTLRPSVKTTSHMRWTCHSWINEGSAQFLSDSTHELSGATVPLLEVGI